MLQQARDGDAVGCRRLIASAAVLATVAAAFVPAAFAHVPPLALRDNDDAPAGAISGTRVRSIGAEAEGAREKESARKIEKKGKPFLFFFLRSIGEK